jgi:hypothetical protein
MAQGGKAWALQTRLCTMSCDLLFQSVGPVHLYVGLEVGRCMRCA